MLINIFELAAPKVLVFRRSLCLAIWCSQVHLTMAHVCMHT